MRPRLYRDLAMDTRLGVRRRSSKDRYQGEKKTNVLTANGNKVALVFVLFA